MRNGPYELIVAPVDYPGRKYRGKYAYEHIVVWWRRHGRLPPVGYEIHHVNTNHRDNRIENLQLLTSAEHKAIHAKMSSEAAQVDVICFYCKTEFRLRKRDYNMRMKKPTKRIFCSRACGAKNQQQEKRK